MPQLCFTGQVGCHSAAQRWNLLFASVTPPHAAREYNFYVYIMASRSRTLYIGVTNNLSARVLQHREDRPGSFKAKYKIHRLGHSEHFKYVVDAIAREKELKDWNRSRKIDLIQETNPTWKDLAASL